VRLNLHNILVYEFLIGDWLTGHNINHINLAIVVFMSLVIEENVLCAIISLINQEHFSTILVLTRGDPCCLIIMNAHS
jgi:hypothetical protein